MTGFRNCPWPSLLIPAENGSSAYKATPSPPPPHSLRPTTITAMSGKTAAYVAVSVSLLSVCCCVLFVPLLLAKIGQIQSRLKLDMDEFKVVSDDVWREIQGNKRNPVHASARKTRQAFGGQCQCDQANACPPGAVGPSGADGMDGERGKDGLNGEPGLPGTTPPLNVTPDGRCRVCPPGPRGQSGSIGAPGPSGGKGLPGIPGRRANDGRPGASGPPGTGGEAGSDGKNGNPGQAGQPGSRGSKGENGRDGNDGQAGPKGPNGFPGRAGIPGRPGQPGAPGLAGPPGDRPEPGLPGFAGGQGPPGEDAQYCPCPRRSSLKELQEGFGSFVKEAIAGSLGLGEKQEADSSETSDYEAVPESDRIKIGQKAKAPVTEAPTTTAAAPESEEVEVTEKEEKSEGGAAPIISYVTRILRPEELTLLGRPTFAPPVEEQKPLTRGENAEKPLEVLEPEAIERELPEIVVFPAQAAAPAIPKTGRTIPPGLKPAKKVSEEDEYDTARVSILRRIPTSFNRNEKDAIFRSRS